eukprot:255268-Prymnesium_polylepis.1
MPVPQSLALCALPRGVYLRVHECVSTRLMAEAAFLLSFRLVADASLVRVGPFRCFPWTCLSARLDLLAPLSLAMHVGWCAAVSADVTLRLLVSVLGGVTASGTLPRRLVATGCGATEKVRSAPPSDRRTGREERSFPR